MRLHARDGNVLPCGGEANARQLWRMSGCWQTCCSADTGIAAGVRMHGWLRCGQTDASVLRRTCRCERSAAWRLLACAASGGARRRVPGCNRRANRGAATCRGKVRLGGGKRAEARCYGFKRRAGARRGALRQLQAGSDKVAAIQRQYAVVCSKVAAGVRRCGAARRQ